MCTTTLVFKVLFMLSFEEQANTGMLQGNGQKSDSSTEICQLYELQPLT